MKRLLALVPIALALLGGVNVARASTVTGSSELQAQYAEAVAYWGQTPECATVALSYEAPNPTEGGHADVPREGDRDCGVAIVEGQRRCAETELVRHEVGHLLGLGHSEDPADVMYGDGASKVWTLCEVEAETRLLGSYERWMGREVRRCRHRAERRRECFAGLSSIREEVQARRAALASR